MDNVVSGSECGMDNTRIPVFQNVADDLGLCGCIRHSVASVVVEGRVNAVTIAASKFPGPSCIGLVVYEKLTASRANWFGILVKRAIEVLPG